MSVQSFQHNAPNAYPGLEDYVPEELQPFALELIRRLQQNQDKLITDLTNQVVVDTSLIPTITSGQGESVSYSAASSDDVEDAEIIATMWGEN